MGKNSYIIMATQMVFFLSFHHALTFALGSQPLSMPVIKKLSSDGFTCEMCQKSTFDGRRYLYETFDFSPKNPSRQLIICKKCAIREHGSKYKKKFDEIFN